MGVITFLFVSIGLLGYLAVGDKIEASITLNLPSEGLLYYNDIGMFTIPGIRDRDFLFWARSKNPETPEIPGIGIRI